MSRHSASWGGQLVAAVDSDGWLRGVERRPSPNRDARPAGTVVDLLVIHNISLPPGEFGGPWIDDLFLARLDPEAHPYFRAIAGVPVSAHLLIRRDGHCIQYVPFGERAWHAGASCFAGRERCNDFSVGIELEGADDQPFHPSQYQALAAVTRALMAAYPEIRPERIAGHSDIAPGRKTDPGPYFDWNRFLGLVVSPPTPGGGVQP
jgi:N-acetyl-anhydromuramoyl-L-alanine amidase